MERFPGIGRREITRRLNDGIDTGISDHLVRCLLTEIRNSKNNPSVKRSQDEVDYGFRSSSSSTKEVPHFSQHNNTAEQVSPFSAKLLATLKRGPVTLSDLVIASKSPAETIISAVTELRSSGHTVIIGDDTGLTLSLRKDLEIGGNYKIDVSRLRNEPYKFGWIADTHLASKHQRLDVCNALYDIFEREGITEVYHGGNYVDGEARFNRYDLLAHGITGQLNYFIDKYPYREGITTHFVAGDDHEGWWAQREGIDIGTLTESMAVKAGRNDLHYLGYIEADVNLEAANGHATMRVAHAGGGSAYSYSYKSQKLAECVPLSTKILTKTGWKSYKEISVADEVLGYNIETGKNEWTKVTHVNVHKNTPMFKYHNKHFSVMCTENHRWPMLFQQRGGKNPNSTIQTNYMREETIMATIDEAKERSRLILTAPSPDGDGFGFSSRESIIDRTDVETCVMKMTSAERQAFIYGMMIGEGTVTNREKHTQKIGLCFTQNPGAILEGFKLACFLEGIFPGETRRTSKKMNGEEKVCCKVTLFTKQTRLVNYLSKEYIGDVDSWCPTTELGTWVMKQGNIISITGNSLQPGEKPQIMLLGHYHKFDLCYPRGVWTLQMGCTKDQDSFARKKQLDYHVGGGTAEVRLTDDGSVTSFKPEFIPFYDRTFHMKAFDKF